MNLLKRLTSFLRDGRNNSCLDRNEAARLFRTRYASFKALLESNSELLKIMGDMEEKLRGDSIFGMAYVRSSVTRAIFHAMRLARALHDTSGGKHDQLLARVEEIQSTLKNRLDLVRETESGREAAYVLEQADLFKEMVDIVGGKNANLGETRNVVGLPVPDGFAVTTRACAEIIAGDLREELEKLALTVMPDDPGSITQASEGIQALILRAEIPPPLAEDLFSAFDRLAERAGMDPSNVRIAVRSSAMGEDSGELSFAGQYVSVLGVTRARLLESYKYVLASLFTPRAMAYRLSKGVPDDATSMSVACLRMIDSKASGVAYSRHPFKMLERRLLINAVWGLGPYVVDGVIEPDSFLVNREASVDGRDAPGRIEARVSEKPVMLRLSPEGAPREERVPPELRSAPSLTEAQIRQLADWVLRLEEHYGSPQDVEWALDDDERLFILQTRPLTAFKDRRPALHPGERNKAILLDGAEGACAGVGAGPVFHVRTDDDLQRFPQGAVLVAAHSSPKFMVVMNRASAIVAEHGSVTGHMASLAREFGTPTLVNARNALALLPQDRPVTIDAYAGRVYDGAIEGAEKPAQRTGFMRGTAVWETLRNVAELIVPLNLIDPKSPDFSPEGCRSIHDVTRYAHERSYQEMFRISDKVSDAEGCAIRLKAPIPLDLYVIDLGGGLVPSSSPYSSPEEVVSIPFKAILDGMLHADLRHGAPRPVNLGGFLSVMSEQMLAPPRGGERFGDKSYAIIADKYLNFSSRVGYHYSVLDSYCGKTVNKNYIVFTFKGGAANETRRGRRVRAIALILRRLGFDVETQGDRVDARFQKFDEEEIREKLEQLGRLLIFTRQMDMLMINERSIDLAADCFLSGNYHFDPAASGDSSCPADKTAGQDESRD